MHTEATYTKHKIENLISLFKCLIRDIVDQLETASLTVQNVQIQFVTKFQIDYVQLVRQIIFGRKLFKSM